jgi:hypothetical protein
LSLFSYRHGRILGFIKSHYVGLAFSPGFSIDLATFI